MALEINDTHAPAGLLKLVPPFWGKPRMAALLVVLLEEVQALEDAIWTVIDGLDVDTCNRWVLEQLAAIVGEPSRPTDDELLRTRVKGRILANRSDATAASVCALAEALSGETGQLLEFDRAVKVITLNEPPAGSVELLDAGCAGTVAAAWLTEGTFAWPDYNDPSPPSTGTIGVGTWSDYNETT